MIREWISIFFSLALFVSVFSFPTFKWCNQRWWTTGNWHLIFDLKTGLWTPEKITPTELANYRVQPKPGHLFVPGKQRADSCSNEVDSLSHSPGAIRDAMVELRANLDDLTGSSVLDATLSSDPDSITPPNSTQRPDSSPEPQTKRRKRRRKRMLTGVSRQRRAANERERRRIQGVNRAFIELKNTLPVSNMDISKIDILRVAANWIDHLSELLSQDDRERLHSGDSSPAASSPTGGDPFDMLQTDDYFSSDLPSDLMSDLLHVNGNGEYRAEIRDCIQTWSNWRKWSACLVTKYCRTLGLCCSLLVCKRKVISLRRLEFSNSDDFAFHHQLNTNRIGMMLPILSAVFKLERL